MIGIITAMGFEKKALTQGLRLKRVMEVYRNAYELYNVNGTDTIVVACGEGKVNAARCAQTLISEFGVSHLINIGVAGSLVDDMNLGRYIIADSVVQYDLDMRAIGVPIGLVPCGERSREQPWGAEAITYIKCNEKYNKTIAEYMSKNEIDYSIGVIATGDTFVSCGGMKRRIASTFGALACDMESAAIGYVSYLAGIDFNVIRKISDGADENAESNYTRYQTVFEIDELVSIIAGNDSVVSGF